MSHGAQPQHSAIDYTSRDFAALRESMLQHAEETIPEWRGAHTGDPNDIGVALIEAFAHMGDILSYYTDRLANESYLSTAVQRSSVLRHAQHLGYTPRSATAATAALTFTVTTRRDVTIPAGFKVSTVPGEGEEPIVFETLRDLTFPASTASPTAAQTLVVEAEEGVLIEDEIVATSTGDLNAVFTLTQRPVIVDSLVVRVVEKPGDPGHVWFPANNLLDVSPGDLAYALSLGANDELSIRFGDGTNGRVPPRGAVIHARYRVGGGADGNVVAGSITEVVDPADIVFPLPDPTQTGEFSEPPLIEVTNLEPAGGGADSESLDSIRSNTPRAVRTQERAVSLEDFQTLALTIPQVQVAKAKAVGKVYTNITIFVAPPGGTTPSQQMLTSVVDFFDARKMAGVSVVAATPQYVPVDLDVDVIVDDRFNQGLVRLAVQRTLQGLLAFDNVDFGQRVSLADIYSAVLDVEGVRNVIITKLDRAGGTAVTDLILRANEVPVQGDMSVNAIGGVVNSAGAHAGIGSPTATAAPTLDLIRCDPNSTHIELSWVAGANTTSWDIVIAYRNADNVVVQSLVAGPYSTPKAVIDVPLIGSGRATSVAFTTRAYNSNIGPAVSEPTTTPYTCG